MTDERLCETLSLISNPIRLALVRRLQEAGADGSTPTFLASVCGLRDSVVSEYLQQLCCVELVTQRQAGRYRFYFLNLETMLELSQALDPFQEQDDVSDSVP